MTNEIWKDIPGYEGMYQVSNLGRVKGLPRKVNNHTGFIHLKERIIGGHQITKGYIQIQLSSRPKRVLRLIHVLVAQSFIPNPKNYPQVNHINGNKTDNRVSNLEWCNNSMNQIHAYKNGLNWHRETAGKRKRALILKNIQTGNEVVIESIAKATSFLSTNRSNVHKVLSTDPKYKSFKTIKGYEVKYA